VTLSALHESVVLLVQRSPELAPELLTGALRIEVPPWSTARTEDTTFSESAPTQRRADVVVSLRDAEGAIVIAIVMATVAETTRLELEEWLMSGARYEYQSDFARRFVKQGREEGREEGREDGVRGALLAILEARRLPLDDQARTRIATASDLALLEAWVRRAAIAARIEDVFADTAT
jgi:hypothetical protein